MQKNDNIIMGRKDPKQVRKDQEGERIAHEFLVENFYKGMNYIEITDKERQVKGIDTIFYSSNGTEYLCDEKVALDYINKDHKLPTFCNEISSAQVNGTIGEGWFTSDKMENNCYIYLWVDRARYDTLTSKDDIYEAEYMLIWKQDIIDYLNSLGWTKERLREKARRIRYEGDRNFGNIYKNGCKFSVPNKEEKPVNVLITREVYRSMPHTRVHNFKKEEN